MSEHGKYELLVSAAAACVVGWPEGETPAWVLQLALGLKEAGVPADVLTESLGEGWEARADR